MVMHRQGMSPDHVFGRREQGPGPAHIPVYLAPCLSAHAGHIVPPEVLNFVSQANGSVHPVGVPLAINGAGILFSPHGVFWDAPSTPTPPRPVPINVRVAQTDAVGAKPVVMPPANSGAAMLIPQQAAHWNVPHTPPASPPPPPALPLRALVLDGLPAEHEKERVRGSRAKSLRAEFNAADTQAAMKALKGRTEGEPCAAAHPESTPTTSVVGRIWNFLTFGANCSALDENIVEPQHIPKTSPVVQEGIPKQDQFVLQEAPEEVIKWSFNLEKSHWTSKPIVVVVDKVPFSEGSMRLAYRMVDLSKPEGDRACVAKALKELPRVNRQSYFVDIEMQAQCEAIADAFNAYKPPKEVRFIPAFLIHRKAVAPTHLQMMSVEPFLSGNYIKYNNNMGFVSYDDRNTPQAFSHFSHHFMRGKLIIVDIQGVGDQYTDPQIHTWDRKGYGSGNCGQQGIDAFFATHTCNSICKYLRLPNFYHGRRKFSGTQIPCDPRPNGDVHKEAISPGYVKRGMQAELQLSVEQFDALAKFFGQYDHGTGYISRSEIIPLLEIVGLFDDKCHRKLTDLPALLDKPIVSFLQFLQWWTGVEWERVS